MCALCRLLRNESLKKEARKRDDKMNGRNQE